MATLPVKWYSSTQQGAPVLSGTPGDLITLLDACLVNGFNSKTLTSLTQTGNVATATIAGGHLFTVDSVVKIAGAGQADYNGEFRVLTADATTFTFAVLNNPVTPATGTITCVFAPLNFQKVFSGTNKAVYRSTNAASNKPYLRVDNSIDPLNTATYAKKGKVTLAESMTDVDTFTANLGRAPFSPAAPTQNEAASGAGATVVDGWYKWYYARQESASSTDATAPVAGNRNWVIVGDDRGFYFFTEFSPGSGYGKAIYGMTDFASYRAGDGYNSILLATEFYSNASTAWTTTPGPDYVNYMNRTLEYTGKVCMRDHTQVGNTVRLGLIPLGTLNGQQISGYSTGVPWPNGPDYSLVLHPIYLNTETSLHLRGKLPGIMWVHNNSSPMLDQTVVSNVTGYAGRKFLILSSAYNGLGPVARYAFDITGPWW